MSEVRNKSGLKLNSDPALFTLSFDDIEPPIIDKVSIISRTQIDIIFSESLDQESATNTNNYLFDPDLDVAGSAVDSSVVHVYLKDEIQTRTKYLIEVQRHSRRIW